MNLTKLIAPAAALMLALPVSSSATELSLTFNRTGQYPESVTVLTSGIQGVQASMTSSSKLFKTNVPSPTSKLIVPDVNGNTSPNIVMEFTVTGLPEGFSYDNIGLNIHATNNAGEYQAHDDGPNRQWNVSISTGSSSSSLSEFASKYNFDIAKDVNPTGFTRNKVWDFTAPEAVSATDPLVIRLNISADAATNEGCFFGLSEIIISGEVAAPAPTVVSTTDFFGLLTLEEYGEITETPDSKITLTEYSDGTYSMLLENFGATEEESFGLGDIEIRDIHRDGNNIEASAQDYPILGGMVKSNIELTGTYDDTDLEFHVDVTVLGFDSMELSADFTTKTPAPTGLTFRRYSTDGSKRYYDNISYSVDGETTELYSVADPLTEPYYVAPVTNAWQTEGAYIDLTDKVIEVPANAENFTIILKSKNGATYSSKWSQNAIYVDWNGNGDYTDEGETNGVLNLGTKPNQPNGGLVCSENGETDVITLPEGLNVGDTFSVLIAMHEPKDLATGGDYWDSRYDWTSDVFEDGVCSLINGEAYELTLTIVDGTTSAINSINTENAEAEYFNLQGMKVAANHLTPGIYVVRKGNETFKTLVK